jgi:hypothetical protein
MNVRRALTICTLLLGLAATGCEEDHGKSAPPAADASPATQDAAPGQLEYLEACQTNEQCQSGLCFNFNQKGPHCTKECTTAAECPAPSPGCNGMGVCKAP